MYNVEAADEISDLEVVDVQVIKKFVESKHIVCDMHFDPYV